MKLSTKGRYGLRAIYDLALNYGKGPISIKTISKLEDLSEGYLEQLFVSLKKDNLVKSVRGPKGGYVLSKSPDQIFVGEILRSLEGDMAPSSCLGEDNFKCDNEDKCVTKFIWVKIKDAVDNVIDSLTLQDMIEENIGGLKSEE